MTKIIDIIGNIPDKWNVQRFTIEPLKSRCTFEDAKKYFGEKLGYRVERNNSKEYPSIVYYPENSGRSEYFLRKIINSFQTEVDKVIDSYNNVNIRLRINGGVSSIVHSMDFEKYSPQEYITTLDEILQFISTNKFSCKNNNIFDEEVTSYIKSIIASIDLRTYNF